MIQHVVGRVHGAVIHLSDSSDALRQEAQVVGEEIAKVLVALQFQDRVNQVLGHVCDDMNKLKEHISTPAPQKDGAIITIDATSWLDELSQTYTVEEQYEVHRGSKAKVAVSEITFF